MGASNDPTDACKKEACQIQTCFSRNQYNMVKCAQVVEKLRSCCRTQGKASVHCQSLIKEDPASSSEKKK